MHSGDGSDKREIVVRESEMIEKYFEKDEITKQNFQQKKTKDKKAGEVTSVSSDLIFDETIAQYCDIDNGLVIKVYNMSKFNAYVETIENKE